MLYDGFYGSDAGGWLYQRTANAIPPWAVVLGLLLATAAIALARASLRVVERRPAAVIALWLAAAFFAQLAVWSLYREPLEVIVLSGTNGFFEVAERHTLGEFLREFRTLTHDHLFHVRANLIGKVLFSFALRTVTESPRETAWLIIFVSNLGGVLAYAVARELFVDRAAGLAALVLYLFLPAKLYFFPLMNTITPVFILLPFWMLLRFCATRRVGWLVGVGLSLYWLVLFDPLPLASGLVFVAVLFRASVRGDIGARDALKAVTVVPLAFATDAWVMTQATGYDVLEALRFAAAHAREFNEANNRPYGIWLVQNLIDFLVNVGLATTAVFLWLSVAAVRQLGGTWHRGWRALVATAARTDVSIVLAVLAVLIVLDGMGVNRGEVIRLWIFLGVFVLIPVAGYCARRPLLLGVVLASAILQSCCTLSTREFVLPW